jgi:cyclophilin family peptidyl-prolyl cis-trans isomerase
LQGGGQGFESPHLHHPANARGAPAASLYSRADEAPPHLALVRRGPRSRRLRDGTGGSQYPDLQAEFSDVPFRRGVVGMARRGNSIHSANRQFFIMYAETPSLNGQYTVVGEVVSGMDVVDKLNKGSGQSGMVANPDRIVRATVGGS